MKRHWPEYLMEAFGLGAFMMSACVFAVILESPGSPVRQVITDGNLRRVFMGLSMGLTAVALIYSPWGRQSGAHYNPAVTLTFLKLGKVRPGDAAMYILAQFAGGTLGVVAASLVLGDVLGHPAVNYAATVPGPWGATPAFLAEVAITFILMTMVLHVSNHPRRARFTGVFAGCLVALYIAVEAPVSGMSMNPARTFSSAFSAHVWTGIWIYFTAPLAGMLLAARLYVNGARRPVACAKIHHAMDRRCIHCGHLMAA
jgi:aquaporin Z